LEASWFVEASDLKFEAAAVQAGEASWAGMTDVIHILETDTCMKEIAFNTRIVISGCKNSRSPILKLLVSFTPGPIATIAPTPSWPPTWPGSHDFGNHDHYSSQ
jgi:hypothetical protein